jgi:hypothetical protein
MEKTNRDSILASLRPDIVIDTDRVSLSEEFFQQKALRPILKLQNELIMAYFINKTVRHQPDDNAEAKALFVENTLRKDAVLRNQLIGLIVGLFTADEFAFYLQHASSLNKRIAQLLIKRIKDQY